MSNSDTQFQLAGSGSGVISGDHEELLSRTTSVKQVFKNALFNSGSWTVTVFVALLSTPYIVYKLGVEGYGVYALLTGLIGFYNLLDLGLGQGVIKYVAEYKAKEDYEKINLSINAALWVQICTGLVGSLALIIFADPILKLLRISQEHLSDAKVGIYSVAIGFFLTLLSLTLSAALMGLQRYDITSRISITSNLFLTVITIFILFLGAGIKEVIYLAVSSNVIVFLIYLLILRHKLPQWRFSFSINSNLFRELFQFSGFLFISRLSSLFGDYVVRFIVGFFLGPVSVTYYVIPWKMIVAFSGLLSGASGVLFPYASEIGATGDRSKAQKTFIEASKILASFSVPVYLALFIFSKPILTLWMGNEFAERDWFILSMLSLAALLASLTVVPNLVTMGLGHSKVVGLFSLLTLTFYITLVPILTIILGIEGTSLAMVCATLPGLALVIYETEKIVNLRLWRYLREVFGFHFIPILASFIFIYPSQRILTNSSIWAFFLLMMFFLIYFGVMVGSGWMPLHRLIDQLMVSRRIGRM